MLIVATPSDTSKEGYEKPTTGDSQGYFPAGSIKSREAMYNPEKRSKQRENGLEKGIERETDLLINEREAHRQRQRRDQVVEP